MTASTREAEGTGEGTGEGAGDIAGAAAGVLFAGPGEMRARCRAHDWAATPLGLAEGWPAALRVAVRLMLASPVATSLWCGPEYTLLYNDAYAPILGAKHPGALGRSGTAVWAELWPALEPEFARVRAGGPPVFADDALLRMERLAGGRAEDAWFTYALSALTDEAGACLAVYNVAVEVTERARAAAALRASEERLRLAVAATGLGVFDWDLATDQVTVNARFREMLGLPPGGDVIGASMLGGVVHPEDRAVVEAKLADAFDPRSAGSYQFEHRALTPDGEVWLLTFGQVYFAGEGGDRRAVRVIGNDLDVTAQVLARREIARLLAESEAANAQLQEQALELELANQQLQDQTVELELQAEELHATAAELEERTEEAEKARARAEAERARAAAILEATADAYFALDGEFRIVAVNAAMERSTGFAREALLGRLFWEMFPGTVGTAYERHYRAAVTEGAEAHFTGHYSDGRLELVSEADVYPVAGGGVAVFWRDVTQRVRAEAALRASEALLRDVFEQAPVAMAVLTGPDHVYAVMSPRYAEYTTTGRAGLGRPFREAVPEIGGQGLIELMDRVYRSGEPFFAHERLVRLDRDGDGVLEDYYFDVGYQPLRDEAGSVYGVASVSREVTREVVARREVEAARADAERAREAAEQANRAKAEFLATMSHELRTPLNAIGGYAELLELGLRGPVTEQQRTDLARIQQSQRHLLGLVNEVLDLAKVDSGELRVERATVRAGDTVDAALALVRPQAAAKALALAEACGGAVDRPFLGDEPRVRQVLVNLLANAVKFTAPGGHVSVTCALTDAPPAGAALAPDTPYVALRVEDTGVGIAPDQLARIFEPFTQAEGGLTRPRGGTGLGLAISRRLARLMGGDLTVESRVGSGSAFTLWLPTPERRAHPRPHAATAGPERRTPPAPRAVEAPGVAQIGEALVAEVGPVLRAWVGRLRADPQIPDAAARSDAELEDHAATFVTDVALALRTMGQPSGEPAALLRDGTAILALIAERHGAQRARLGWPEAAVAREHALLAEVLDAAVRRLAEVVDVDAAAAARALEVVTSLLAQAARLSVGGYRLVTGVAGA